MLDVNDLIYRSKISDHESKKKQILNWIEYFGTYSLIDNRVNRISNSDWHLDQDMNKGYMDIIADDVARHHNGLCQELGFEKVQMGKIWFQQYETGDYFYKHNHPDSTFSNVAYIELPDERANTRFYWKGEEIQIDIEEGEILSFPGFLLHDAPTNLGPRKSIVVWNSIVE
jgi:hypothetical protein